MIHGASMPRVSSMLRAMIQARKPVMAKPTRQEGVTQHLPFGLTAAHFQAIPFCPAH